MIFLSEIEIPLSAFFCDQFFLIYEPRIILLGNVASPPHWFKFFFAENNF